MARKILFALLLCMLMPTLLYAAQAEDKPVVKFETNYGDFLVQLDPRKAPITAANFIQYVKSGHYDSTIFHRVIPGFMIQGGGMTQNMEEKRTFAPIKNEANNNLKNNKYTIAMARTNDPNSATSQFFINTNNNEFLNFKSATPEGWGYAVFGKVIKGQETIDKIEKVETGSKRIHENVPLKPVIIKKAVMVEQ